MILKYGSKPVLIQRILIGFEGILEYTFLESDEEDKLLKTMAEHNNVEEKDHFLYQVSLAHHLSFNIIVIDIFIIYFIL